MKKKANDSRKKLAVLTVDDIMGYIKIPGAKLEPVATCDGANLYSSGILENLIIAGYDIWIISPLRELRECDAWWHKIVPNKSQALFAKMADGKLDELAGWRELYGILKLEWRPRYTVYEASTNLQTQRVFVVKRHKPETRAERTISA